MSLDKQHYWGERCVACSKFHPVKIAFPDTSEPPPRVEKFVIMSPTTREDIGFDLCDLLKYVGPADENFQPHQLFLEPDTPPGRG